MGKNLDFLCCVHCNFYYFIMVKGVLFDSAYALVLVYRFILQARVCVFRIGYFWFIVHGLGSTV
jgi:hypothetical protein